MVMVVCPDCEATFTLKEKPEIGKRVTCPECHEVFEVVEVDPVELDWPDDDYDDWYEDEDEEEEREDDW